METEDLASLLDTLRKLDTDTSTIEAKKAKGGLPTRLWETLSAFSNAQGGAVLLGVDEKNGFAVCGVNDPGTMESKIASMCSDEMVPALRPLIQTHTIEGRSVVTVEVPPLGARQKPCYYRGLGCYGGSFIRVGDNDRKLTEYEVNLLVASRGQPADDEQPVMEASADDLDEDAVNRFVSGQRRQHPRAFGAKSTDEVLTAMRVLVEHEHRLVPTRAGLLALGMYPQQFIPQLNVTFVVYPTVEAGVAGPDGERFLDNATLDGPVSEMVTLALLRLRRNMRKRSVVAGLTRHDVWEYPETALREAVVNALVHRDLSTGALGSPTQIEMYPDRLVIRNPGGLYGPVNVADLPTSNISSTRNRTLLKLLENVEVPDGGTLCEARGSGISAMIAALRSAGMSIPIFADNVGSFQVTFPNASLLDEETIAWLSSLGQVGLSEAQILALSRMRNGELLNNNSYRSLLGVDSRVATTELRDLVDRGLATPSGSHRWTTYALATETDPVGRNRPEQLNFSLTMTKGQAPTDELPNPPGFEHELSARILNALRDGPLTRRDLETALGVPSHVLLYRLRRLRAQGLVEQTGSQRSPRGKWQLSQAP